jgi:crotonobetainyl-CoA:carnitine CoA-transferase CaiB-like acyl-CoA transferase
VFPTADGHINVIALRDAQVKTLFELTGLLDALSQPEFATASARMQRYEEVYTLLAEALTTKTTARWLALFAEHGLPAAAIREFAEVVADPQFEHRGVFTDMVSPMDDAQTVRLIQSGYVADADGPGVGRPAPTLGEHTDEVLAELGYDQAAIADLRNSGVI